MADQPAAGILDTSVVIDLPDIAVDALPTTVAVTTVTMAELAAGPAATTDPAERARRQERLQSAEAAFEALPFDARAARAYGLVYAAVRERGRQPRGRLADLLIASIAVAEGLPLVTRNPADFAGLDDLLHVVAV
ncbi:hypothetical protein BCF74_13626 [Knoellia remsis]|uniref:PIN domain-containing protein n=1 Tax=Knoellia remsis TaxID=407159 RepID=A0A2T0U0H9_9MICO|nr:type II toxin-antitoxin system VapC family toxin [Knoellia remsis]PRY51411.1 hypothetical protein BCF74_13626 [Knoellia remsis]